MNLLLNIIKTFLDPLSKKMQISNITSFIELYLLNIVENLIHFIFLSPSTSRPLSEK